MGLIVNDIEESCVLSPAGEEAPYGWIDLVGVRVHNLKGVSLRIPRGRFVALTGLSGSGKSSLAFDTLYAEGHRRYVQSLSSYARQFLDRLPKPEADRISGVPPSIVIEQRVSNRNPRSTVGTTSEIYEYLRLLYARVGRLYSPVSGAEVRIHTVEDVVRGVLEHEGERVYLLAPLDMPKDKEDCLIYLDLLVMEGFSRLYVDGELITFDSEEVRRRLCRNLRKAMYLMVDRFRVDGGDEDFRRRLGDSAETAFTQGGQRCRVLVMDADGGEGEAIDFSGRLEADGIEFQAPTPQLFSYNSPLGACPVCEGFGRTSGLDEDLIIPDKRRSVYDDAVVCWCGPTLCQWRDHFIEHAVEEGFPIHRPYYQLTEDERRLLWDGNDHIEGINDFFRALESKRHKIQNRVMLARFTGYTQCPGCHGKRLRREASYVKINGKSLPDLVDLPLEEVASFIGGIELNEQEQVVASRILEELNTRLGYLLHVGLGYLTINRTARTLSGGETQRINLATSLGGSLVGTLYILDEPSVGLHPVDSARLVEALEYLRDIGNTVVVVEHDESIMRAADLIIDLGPGAGRNGGEVVAYGTPQEVMSNPLSLTGQYMSGRLGIPVPAKRRSGKGRLEVEGILANNVHEVDVSIPLEALTVVTGVSGSGKSTLVDEGIRRAVEDLLLPSSSREGLSTNPYYRKAQFVGGMVYSMQYVDQNPLARSLRSTPVTYVNAYDPIRYMFAEAASREGKELGPGAFSFNISGGRCEVCEGTGVEVVEMQFMADIEAPCSCCHGKRFRDEVLSVGVRGKSISDVLEMTIDEAIEYFEDLAQLPLRPVVQSLKVMQRVGLGYISLGQSTSTLSGGEAQRLKLASFLLNPRKEMKTLFLFDEPTTGLHFHDIGRLMVALNDLVEAGHTVLVIEHNVEVMKLADYIIDMGPGAGVHGGRVVACGTPEEVSVVPESVTAPFLAQALKDAPGA